MRCRCGGVSLARVLFPLRRVFKVKTERRGGCVCNIVRSLQVVFFFKVKEFFQLYLTECLVRCCSCIVVVVLVFLFFVGDAVVAAMTRDPPARNHNGIVTELPFELPKNPPSYEETMCVDFCLKPHKWNAFSDDYFQRYIKGDFVDFCATELGAYTYPLETEETGSHTTLYTTRMGTINTTRRTTNTHPYRHSDHSFSHGINGQLEYEER